MPGGRIVLVQRDSRNGREIAADYAWAALCDPLAQHEVQHDDNGKHRCRQNSGQAEVV